MMSSKANFTVKGKCRLSILAICYHFQFLKGTNLIKTKSFDDQKDFSTSITIVKLISISLHLINLPFHKNRRNVYFSYETKLAEKFKS